MQKGEIWRVKLPFASGHVQAGDRPALTIQNDALTALLPTVLIVPFTGVVAALRFPGTLLVQPDAQNGLAMPSVALAFQARAVDKQDLTKRMGTLDVVTLQAVLDLLQQLIG